MADFYEVVVDVVVSVTKAGNDKINKEIYLVDAMSVTEAEAKVVDDFIKAKTQLEYTVSSAKQSRIHKVIG